MQVVRLAWAIYSKQMVVSNAQLLHLRHLIPTHRPRSRTEREEFKMPTLASVLNFLHRLYLVLLPVLFYLTNRAQVRTHQWLHWVKDTHLLEDRDYCTEQLRLFHLARHRGDEVQAIFRATVPEAPLRLLAFWPL